MPAEGTPRALSALGQPLFRLLLIIQLANAVAVWVHVTSAQWLLTARDESAFVVSLAPAAMALPFLALALPAGVVVSYASRERLAAAAMWLCAVSAGCCARLSIDGTAASGWLIGAVFVVGAGLVLVGVGWQSMLPELVPRPLVGSAALLDGAVFNSARAAGPLFAGLGLARFGPSRVFGFAAVLFGGSAAAIGMVQRRRPGRTAARMPMIPAVVGVLRFVRHSPWTSTLLLQMVLFGLPASALWALISLVVHQRLGLAAGGFGIMMALIGLGAVLATVGLGTVRARLGVRPFVSLGYLAFATVLVVLAFARSSWLVPPFLVVVGMAWVGVQSTWMMLAHQALPNWIRPRVVALLLLLFQGTQALGAALWGALTDRIGLVHSLLVAAATMAASLAILVIRGLGSSEGIEPILVDDPATSLPALLPRTTGPLNVRYRYRVDAGSQAGFTAAVRDVRRHRLRLGATSWSLYADPSEPITFVEQYVVASARELTEQETVRLTVPEHRLRETLLSTVEHVEGPQILTELPMTRRDRWRRQRPTEVKTT